MSRSENVVSPNKDSLCGYSSSTTPLLRQREMDKEYIREVNAQIEILLEKKKIQEAENRALETELVKMKSENVRIDMKR